jgi:hypothetical protein
MAHHLLDRQLHGAREAGGGAARLNQADVDARLGQRRGHRLRQPLHCELGRTVRICNMAHAGTFRHMSNESVGTDIRQPTRAYTCAHQTLQQHRSRSPLSCMDGVERIFAAVQCVASGSCMLQSRTCKGQADQPCSGADVHDVGPVGRDAVHRVPHIWQCHARASPGAKVVHLCADFPNPEAAFCTMRCTYILVSWYVICCCRHCTQAHSPPLPAAATAHGSTQFSSQSTDAQCQPSTCFPTTAMSDIWSP